MKLETIDFENKEKFMTAIESILLGKEKFRTYTNKEGEVKKIKIISNNRLYFGGNLSLNINQSTEGKIYMSVDYFGVDDRIRIYKNKTNDDNNSNDEI